MYAQQSQRFQPDDCIEQADSRVGERPLNLLSLHWCLLRYATCISDLDAGGRFYRFCQRLFVHHKSVLLEGEVAEHAMLHIHFLYPEPMNELMIFSVVLHAR